MSRPILSLFFLFLLAVGCTAGADHPLTDRGALGKADNFGSCQGSDCDGPSADGNCWCDELCSEFGDCCSDKVELCDGAPQATCAELGGQCLSSPIDVTFGANCEADFGLATAGAECPAFNQTCCVAAEPTCCSLDDQPGENGNPFCIEGATCCADGTWQCNLGNGDSSCPEAGAVCEG